MSFIASVVARSGTTPRLLAINKSTGHRWSPIPKPPPPNYDRLYGVHSVLNTLRVAAQSSQQQGHRHEDLNGSSSSPVRPVILHPHRRNYTCLYVRDFSADGGSDPALNLKRSKQQVERQRRHQQQPKQIPERYTAVRCAAALAKSINVPVVFVPRTELVQLCGERRHQNIVLEVSSYTPIPVRHIGHLNILPRTTTDDTLLGEPLGTGGSRQPSVRIASSPLGDAAQRLEETGDAPPPTVRVVLYLNHIIDPTNIGGILRSAYFFGVDHVILSKDCAACTAAASRVSTGFLEHLSVYRCTVSTEDFLAESYRYWASKAAAETSEAAEASMKLEVVASTVLDSSADVTTLLPSATDSSSSSAPILRLILLGNEDAGLPSSVVASCTHTAHVQSPRQAVLRQRRSARSTAALPVEEDERQRCDITEAVEGPAAQPCSRGDVDSAEARMERPPSIEPTSLSELEKRRRQLQRLARVREKEVSMNVNTACATLLSSLVRRQRLTDDDGGLVVVRRIVS